MKKPQDWEKAVTAAACYLIVGNLKEAAQAAGVGYRTIRGWAKCSWWQRALDEGSRLWLQSLKVTARITLMKGAADDPGLALKLLERLDSRLAPPAIVMKRDMQQIKELAGLTPEQLLQIENMTDEEAIAWLQGSDDPMN